LAGAIANRTCPKPSVNDEKPPQQGRSLTLFDKWLEVACLSVLKLNATFVRS